jgi:ADP-ribose pyrophosphatase YjhB (NUDIX family)
MIQCRFESGDETSLRHMTVAVIAVRDNQILLVKRASHLLEGGKWTIPGGYLDRDETMAQGALRELREETGYAGTIDQLFLIVDRPDRPCEDRQNLSATFLATVGDIVGQPDHESTDVQWISLDNHEIVDHLAFDYSTVVHRYIQMVKTGENPAVVDLK